MVIEMRSIEDTQDQWYKQDIAVARAIGLDHREDDINRVVIDSRTEKAFCPSCDVATALWAFFHARQALVLTNDAPFEWSVVVNNPDGSPYRVDKYNSMCNVLCIATIIALTPAVDLVGVFKKVGGRVFAVATDDPKHMPSARAELQNKD